VSAPKEIVGRFLAAFSTGDVDHILGFLTDDVTWWVSGSVPGMSGNNSKQDLGRMLYAAKDLYTTRALRITPLSMLAEGSYVAVEAEGYAELRSGGVYANRYHFLIHVEGERIRRVKEYSDTQHMRDTFSPA
jgi:ketosteroid isomerase-like protein